AELFFRIRELLHARRDEAAEILVREHGKVFSDALGEVTRGLEVVEHCCGLPTLLKGDHSEQASTGIDVYSIRQPLGVVGGITPYVYETATASGKRCQALGGAKNHMIVLPDADVGAAADAAVSAGYGSAGERCMAVSVVVAVGDVGDRLVAAIGERIPHVRVGDGMDPSSEMGPLVTREHRDRVASYVENAPAEGATVVVDGRAGVPSECFFLNPSLLDDVTTEMKAYVAAILGPVLGVTRVATYEDSGRFNKEIS